MERPAASHGDRLIAAATAVAARYGYGGASVARIIAQAGVSRATFYEQFADKEDCLRAAHAKAAERLRRRGERLVASGGDSGMREILSDLLESAARDPAGARLVLIESLGGRAVRAEHERLFADLEAAVDAYMDERRFDGDTLLEIPARAVLGGIGSIVATRAIRAEAGRLPSLADDLEVWLRSYLVPARDGRRDRAGWAAMGESMTWDVEPEPSPLDRPLPRGRGALSPAAVAGEQRQRAMAAAALVAREKGYEAMTVADVVGTAGISREAFYEHFRSKEDVFLSAQAHALETSLSMAASKFFADESWPDRVWRAALPMLEYIASVPDLTTLDFVESYAVGAAAIRRSFESRMAYTLFLEEGYRQRPEAERLPRLCSEAVAGAILELLRHRAVEGRIEEMHRLAPQAVYLALAPFIGPPAALELIEAKLAG